jgi:hypothetical protein
MKLTIYSYMVTAVLYLNSSVDLQSSNSTSLYKNYSINKLSQKDSGYA